MSIDEIHAFKNARPFRAFAIVTRDGETIYIVDPSHIVASPSGDTVIVSSRDGGSTLPVSQIKLIKTLQPRQRKPQSGRGLRRSIHSSNIPAVNVEEIRELYSAAPFEPFEIVLTKGTAVLVDHPEFMSFSRDHRTVHIHDRDGRTKRIDTKMIVALNEMANGARPRKRKR